MTDRAGLAFVLRWAMGGIIISAVAGAVLFSPRLSSRPDAVIVERAVHNMDTRTCERVLQAFTDRSRAGARILWLWAEESTPGVFATASWVTPMSGPPTLPRPYAFHPTAQAAPPQACSYPSNSLHVMAIEGGAIR